MLLCSSSNGVNHGLSNKAQHRGDPGRDQARQFLQNIEASDTLIVQVRARDETRGRYLLFRYTDKDWSFTDAISFVVMERVGIRLAFTFDDDFSQYGFTRLTADLLRQA